MGSWYNPRSMSGPSKEGLSVLVRSDAVAAVSTELSGAVPNWEEIERRIRGGSALSLSVLKGRLLEIHLRILLETMITQNPHFKLDPIPDGSETDKYRFVKKDGAGYLVVDKVTRRPLVEYDEIALIDGIPVVFEVKAKLGRERVAVSGERISRIFDPIAEYFGGDEYGYFVLVSRDFLNGQYLARQSFEEMGGFLVPLFCRSQDLNEHTKRVKRLLVSGNINET